VDAADGWFRVVVGPFVDAALASAARDELDGFVRSCG
jgi:cell division protein FtsN